MRHELRLASVSSKSQVVGAFLSFSSRRLLYVVDIKNRPACGGRNVLGKSLASTKTNMKYVQPRKAMILRVYVRIVRTCKKPIRTR